MHSGTSGAFYCERKDHAVTTLCFPILNQNNSGADHHKDTFTITEMKNLRVIKGRSLDLSTNIVGYCFDNDTNLLYVVNTSCQLLKIPLDHETSNRESRERVVTTLDSFQGCIKEEDVKLIEFLVEEVGILIVLETGQLFLISLDSKSSACIYNHSKRIVSACVSPAQDFILLADLENNIKLLPIPFLEDSQTYKSNTLYENVSLHKPVGVGWGSKETQFFGLDGRPSQDRSQEKHVVISLSDDDLALKDKIETSDEFKEFSTRRAIKNAVAWRGDGQILATLTYIPESKKHYLKVWNRRLELQYMSEQLIDIQTGLVSYSPNGYYICCAQTRDRHVNEVILFEKNGLVRDRVTLPNIKNIYIHTISWSHNSEVLALIARHFHVKDKQVFSYDILLLFAMQNWHYYLKFTQKLPGVNYSLNWHPNNVNVLRIMSSTGFYSEYSCIFKVTFSYEGSTVAVVDANRVLITPLQHCVIPPPYSAIQLETTYPLQSVAINYTNSINIVLLTFDDFLICTSSSVSGDTNSNLDFPLKVKLDERLANLSVKQLCNNYKKFNSHILPDSETYQNITPISSTKLVASRIVAEEVELVMINLTSTGLDINTKRKFSNLVCCISQCCSIGESEMLSITLDSNLIIIWNLRTDDFHTIQIGNSISNLERISIVDSHVLHSQLNYSVISLSSDLCLRFNQYVIVFNSCSSFRVTENYLVYTTVENMMHFTLLDNLWSMNADSNLETWSQPIEVGGSLITISEAESKVVLQLPRGNLEVLYPRPLLISSLTKLLEEEKYVEACKLARRHRLNMNLLVDCLVSLNDDHHVLTKFSTVIADSDPNLLCLVLTELDSCYTLSGRYRELIKQTPVSRLIRGVEKSIEDKVNRFCKSIILPSEHKYLNPTLQALLKMEPKQMSKALTIVYELDDEFKNEALNFILYFIDIDQLFRDALCTYDTNITLMVASASNKDPKQYLAFLDQLNELEDSDLLRYTIDIYVKHYENAYNHLLSHLENSDKKDSIKTQIIDLVVSKRIFQHAISVLEGLGKKHDLSEVLWLKYADYLFEKRYFNEACLAYSKAQSHSTDKNYISSAFKCLSLIDDWEKLSAMVARATIDDISKKNLLKSISNQLIERKKFHEALVIINEHKIEVAEDNVLLNMITKGSWYLAEFIAPKDQRSTLRNLIEQTVLEWFQERSESWSIDLKLAREHFSRLKTLLSTDRVKKFDPDLYSTFDSSSTVDGSESSSSTIGQHKVARSGATSIKTRNSIKSNKPRQKRITLKPGSRHEDLALIVELKSFMLKQKTWHADATCILAGLYEYSTYKTAQVSSKTLNKFLSDSLTFSHETCELLWPSSSLPDQNCSLYERKEYLNNETYENLDFEIFIKPDLPKALISFEL